VGSSDGAVYAFAATDGTLLWKVQTGGPVLGSAVTADTAKGGSVIWIGSWDHNLYVQCFSCFLVSVFEGQMHRIQFNISSLDQ
jgi:hypothetical protein